MSYLEIIVNNCIYLLCPLALYLIYTTYQKNVDQEKNSMMFEIATISSLYFLLRYGMSFHGRLGAMLFDIPLLLCFFKQRKGFSIIISFLLIFYQTFFLSVNVFFLFIEYSSYFIVYLLLEKEKFTIFTLLHHFFVVHSFFLSMKIFLYLNPLRGYQENLLYLFFVLLIQILISSLVLSFFDKGEKIVDFNTTLYNIEKEKELRASLFKVTHEIKNPIAVCKGYLDMLDVNNQKKVHQYIPIVKDEINRTLTLMDDFLDYTKIKIVKEEIDLILLLEEIEETLSSLFKEKGVLCLIDKKDEEIYFEADYNRLKQVFINLLKNAMVFLQIYVTLNSKLDLILYFLLQFHHFQVAIQSLLVLKKHDFHYLSLTFYSELY